MTSSIFSDGGNRLLGLLARSRGNFRSINGGFHPRTSTFATKVTKRGGILVVLGRSQAITAEKKASWMKVIFMSVDDRSLTCAAACFQFFELKGNVR